MSADSIPASREFLELILLAQGSANGDSDAGSSAVSASSEHPALVVTVVGSSQVLTKMQKIAELAALGATVIAIVGKDSGLEDLCLRAGATSVAREDQPIHEVLRMIESSYRSNGVAAPEGRAHRPKLASHDFREPAESVNAAMARLTRREQTILAELAEGHKVREIAESCILSQATIRSHIRSIFLKLGVNSQLAAVALAHQCGWLPESVAERGPTRLGGQEYRIHHVAVQSGANIQVL